MTSFEDFRANYRTTTYLSQVTKISTARIRYIVKSNNIKHFNTSVMYVHKDEFMNYIQKNPSVLLKKSNKGG